VPVLVGCSSQLPRVHPPQFNAAEAAKQAVSRYDQDGDGVLTKPEAMACPGIVGDWMTYDLDRDDKLTQAELQSRFQQWIDDDTGMMNMRAEVTWNGQHLEGATVKLIPLPFLGDNFHSASGTTDRYGYAFLSVDKRELPPGQQGIFGMQVGLYRVEITHPSVELPARYHSASELGVDLSPADANTGIVFHLKR
jgi:hypothetical protein